MSKWSRRRTKYKPVKIEIGTYARIRALAVSRGVTYQKMVELLVDSYEGGKVVPEKVRAVPEGAKVVAVTFGESS